jgi:hypothetical protein
MTIARGTGARRVWGRVRAFSDQVELVMAGLVPIGAKISRLQYSFVAFFGVELRRADGFEPSECALYYRC